MSQREQVGGLVRPDRVEHAQLDLHRAGREGEHPQLGILSSKDNNPLPRRCDPAHYPECRVGSEGSFDPSLKLSPVCQQEGRSVAALLNITRGITYSIYFGCLNRKYEGTKIITKSYISQSYMSDHTSTEGLED